MKSNHRFNPDSLAKETMGAFSSDRYNSWKSVVTLLADRHFNSWEAEAILRSKHTRWAADQFHKGSSRKPSASCLERYLDAKQISPGCPEVNQLVMDTFAEEYDLVLDEKGRPCREGTAPGNAAAGKILVPLGTPLACDPTSETYWSS